MTARRCVRRKDLRTALRNQIGRSLAVLLALLLDTGIPRLRRSAEVNLTFAKLAERSGAAVLPAFAVWDEAERRCILRFYLLLDMTGEPEEDTRRVQAAIETAIRDYPDQWLWIHRRWKTRPPGERALYSSACILKRSKRA